MSIWRSLGTVLGLIRPDGSGEPAAGGQAMKLVVGLGNHGPKYDGTRHNVGYMVIDRLAEKWGPVQFRKQFAGRIGGGKCGEMKVLLLKPETYMNESGRSVQPALAFYRLAVEDLMVVCDDLNLPLGKIRVRRGGSDGGQKGLRSLSRHLATTEYPRLRVGIGPVPGTMDAADFVLRRFTASEREQMDTALDHAAGAVVTWCESGIEPCMNRFN